jgi:hypothetical protein
MRDRLEDRNDRNRNITVGVRRVDTCLVVAIKVVRRDGKRVVAWPIYPAFLADALG